MQFCQQMQAGVQARKGQLFRGERPPQGGGQGVPPDLVGHPLPGQMPGEVPLRDEPRQRLLFKAAHRAGVQPVFRTPRGQQVFRQHHIGDADAGGQTAGAGGQIHHRTVRPGHALQTGQRAGVEAELGIVIVLDDVALARAARRPVQQFGPAACRHGDAGRELVAGGHIAHRRIRPVQGIQRQAVRIHRQTTARHPIVFQHLQSPGIAGRFHRRRAGQERGQQAQQIFQPGPYDDLVRAALHPPVFSQILGQRLAQGRISLGVAGGQQFRRGIQQLLLQPRPGAEREQSRVHAPGGQVVPHRRQRRGGRLLRRADRSRGFPLRQRQVFLYIKAAALPGHQIPFRRQHLIRSIHRVHRHGQFCRQPPLAGHPGARCQRPGAHLFRQAAVQLFVQRHPGRRIQCCGQMDHKNPLLFMHSAKLTP